MNRFLVYRWPDLPRLAGLALLYAAFAAISLEFFSANGVVSTVWPPSGLALAALMLGGKKYWPGVYAGALAANSMAGSSVGISMFIATGNTLEALAAVWLLARIKHFNHDLTHARDFLWLGAVGASSAWVSVLVGVTTLWQSGFITQQTVTQNLLNWWQGDTLGMILITPLILVWRQQPRSWIRRERMWEAMACFGLALLFGQVIFLGWFHDSVGQIARGYWMFMFVVWGAVRFGRHGTLLIICMTWVQALVGTALGSGIFRSNFSQMKPDNIWFYIFLLTLVGVTLATLMNERREKEKALLAREDDLEEAQRLANLGSWNWNLQSNEVFLSKGWRRIFGLGFTDNGKSFDTSISFEMFTSLIHPDDRETVTQSIKEMQQTGAASEIEYRIIRPDGEQRIIRSYAKVERGPLGNVLRMFGTVLDITERRLAEEVLRESEQRYRNIVETADEGIWMIDAEARTSFVNPKITRMLGYTAEEMLGQPLGNFMDEEGRANLANYIERRRQGIAEQHDFKFQRKDGTVLCALMATNPIFGVSGAYGGALAMITDITDRVHVEQTLLFIAQRGWTSAGGDFIPVVVPYLAEMLGVDFVFIGKLMDDKATVETQILYVKGNIVSNFQYALCDTPCQNVIGESICIYPKDVQALFPRDQLLVDMGVESYAGIPLWDSMGDPLGLLAVMHSSSLENVATVRAQLQLVAARVAADLEHRQAEEKLRLASMVYEHSSEAMVVTDADNLIIAVNPAFTKITGYSFDEVAGKNPSIMKSGHHDENFYQAMWNEINTNGQWQGEVWDKRKNGEIHAKWLTINTIRNENGSVHRYVALFSDITERKLSEELIWRQANFDQLTELPNRHMFHDRLEQEVMKSDRANLPLALLLIDLDQFKEVNDTLGHVVGDALLQEAARRIRSCVREADTVARLGGDEFTVTLSGLSDNSHIEDVAQKIIGELAKPYQLGSEIVYVSASIGIALYPNDGANIDAIMRNADQAMYDAKSKGRNRFSYFTPSLQHAAQTRLRLSNDLRGALKANQFSVYFQPIIDMSTGRIHKAEALLRWKHPTHGMVSPAEFIPLAENMGLINEIGDWVFKESACWVKDWSHQFADDFQVSVNVSPLQFRVEGKFFAAEWLHHLHELGLSGNSIAVEITEGLLLHAESGIIDKLFELRDSGIQVAIDDFGMGYSSLSYLKKFDIDYLKIDQTFVRDLETDENDRALSEAIIVMAHKLGLKVIAEGVETEGQCKLLAAAGCDYAQGYHFAKPKPVEEFNVFLVNNLKMP